jgi:hypothetical protein
MSNASWIGSPTTSSGANSQYYFTAACSGSNTTISNSIVGSNSIIICSLVASPGGCGAPQITTRSAGSFIVNIPSPGVGMTLAYYVLQP